MDIIIIILLLLILSGVVLLIARSYQKPLLNNTNRRKVYVDTSALMDPRLLAVAQTGFMGDELIIPRSVTHELQLLADGKDTEKRLRARAGLETVRELERIVYFDTKIIDDALDNTPVDNRLLDLAKANRGLIMTKDYNLQKVAETEQIDVLNINELALALRAEHLPGEHARVRIVATGSNPKQGVAYLREGTMVVVDDAEKKLGQEIEVEFIRLNQTASGVMMFARPVKPVKNSQSTRKHKTLKTKANRQRR